MDIQNKEPEIVFTSKISYNCINAIVIVKILITAKMSILIVLPQCKESLIQTTN